MRMGILEARKVATQRVRRRARVLRSLQRLWVYTTLVFGLVLVAIPFYWLLRTSLMWEGDIFFYPPKFLPIPPEWNNYRTIFENKLIPLGIFWKNSLVLVTWSVVGDLLSASLVGFGLGRLQWKGRGLLFGTVIISMFLPYQVTIIPLYLMWGKIGWLNTLKPLIVPSFFGRAFFIFLMRQFVMSIPRELDDAARIDGCSTFGIYWRIILPLTAPALATIGIFAFQWKWNEFFLPLIYINTKEVYPLAVGLYFYRQALGAGIMNPTWSQVMAASTLSVLPILVIFFFAQRLFIQGIVISGVKG